MNISFKFKEKQATLPLFPTQGRVRAEKEPGQGHRCGIDSGHHLVAASMEGYRDTHYLVLCCNSVAQPDKEMYL